MLIYLDKALVDKINLYEEELSIIARCGLESKHLILSDPEVTEAIISKCSLNNRESAFYRKVHASYSDFVRLKSHFERYTVVTKASENISLHENVCYVPITFFDDTIKIQKMILLCEDIDDCRVYEKIAKTWLVNKKISNIVNVQIEPAHSGGKNRLVKLYKIYQEKMERFCLAIIDNDISFFKNECSKEIRELGTSNSDDKPLSDYHILKVHELENLLPLHYFKNVLDRNSIDLLESIQKIFNITDDLARFDRLALLDLKNPATYKAFTSKCTDISLSSQVTSLLQSKASACMSIKGVTGHTCETCDVILHCDMGALVDEFLKETVTPHVLLKAISNTSYEEIWNELGSLISSWSCSITYKMA